MQVTFEFMRLQHVLVFSDFLVQISSPRELLKYVKSSLSVTPLHRSSFHPTVLNMPYIPV